MDHSNGHGQQREDALNSTRMNVHFGGCGALMHDIEDKDTLDLGDNYVNVPQQIELGTK